MLFDRRRFKILAQRLDIGGDMQRLDVGELAEVKAIAPGKKPRHGMVIGLKLPEKTVCLSRKISCAELAPAVIHGAFKFQSQVPPEREFKGARAIKSNRVKN
jgi:hypothetical protein